MRLKNNLVRPTDMNLFVFGFLLVFIGAATVDLSGQLMLGFGIMVVGLVLAQFSVKRI